MVDGASRAVLGDLKARLSALYGDRLVAVILFGSYARGDADEDSDIDVLILLRGRIDARAERKRTLPVIAGLSLELYREIRREGVRL
jgi:uncharacterized protein